MSQDIHAIKEFLKVIFDVVVPVVKQAKTDGKFQLSDLLAFINDEDFKKDVGPAFKDITLIPGEFKEFTLVEGFDLAIFLISQSREFLDALAE